MGDNTSFIIRSITKADRKLLDKLKTALHEATDSGCLGTMLRDHAELSKRLQDLERRYLDQTRTVATLVGGIDQWQEASGVITNARKSLGDVMTLAYRLEQTQTR